MSTGPVQQPTPSHPEWEQDVKLMLQDLQRRFRSPGVIPTVETEWSVFTGAPKSGKSTMLKLLKKDGALTVEKAALSYIQPLLDKGFTIDEIRADQREFTGEIYRRNLRNEMELDITRPTLLDRAIPDNLAYLAEHGSEGLEGLRAASSLFRYKHVFLFERLSIVDTDDDDVRQESNEQAKSLESGLEQVYTELGYKVIRVPIFEGTKQESMRKRLNFIRLYLNDTSLADSSFS